MTAVVGVDLGSKRIGVAVATSGVATPLEAIERTADTPDASRIAAIAAERGATRAVVGLPLRLDGSEGEAAAGARRFGDALRAAGLEVVLWDERLTTVEAERSLKAAGAGGRRRRRVVDRTAAAVILQAYLDAQSR